MTTFLALPLLLLAAPQSTPTWRHYTPGNTGIPGDTVVALYLDENDQPWVPGHIPFWEQGGVSHFDGSHWTTISNVDHPAIASPRVYDIVRAPGGWMWIATEDGLLRMDPAVGASSLVRYDASNTPLPAMDVVDLELDPAGDLWLAVDDNETGIGGLARLQVATETWTFWDTRSGLPWGTEWPGWDAVDFVAALPDATGFSVWFGSGPMGMARYKAGDFFWYGLPSLTNPATQPWGFMGRDPVDAQGNAWMMTNKGLARRNPDGTFLITGFPAGFTSEVSIVSALDGGRAALGTFYADVFEHDGAGWTYLGNWGSGQHTYALREDSTGALWAGGLGGVAKRELGTWQRYRLTNTGMLGYFMRTIDFDASGKVYMNGNAAPGVGGFSIFDGQDWTCVNDANYGLGPAWGLPSDEVEALCTMASGKLALAPSGGQGMLEWDGTSFQYLIPQGWSIVEIEEDSLGRLWAAEDYGYGVFLVQGRERTRFTWQNSPLPQGDVDFIVADRSLPGHVWIFATFGFALTDGTSWTVYPRSVLGLTQNSIGHYPTCGDQAADGTLWIGTGRGLYHFDPVTSQFTRYTAAQTALPSDEIWHVEVAPDGTVWASTFDSTYPYPGGLTSFDGTTWTTYDRDNSPLPHNQLACLASRPTADGYELWVGTASEGVAVLAFGGASRPEEVRSPKKLRF